jgi:prophage DNA circulation protein
MSTGRAVSKCSTQWFQREEVHAMDLVMNLTTIEDFHTLLTSDDNSLLATLRELTKIERIKEIVAAVSDAEEYWYDDP